MYCALFSGNLLKTFISFHHLFLSMTRSFEHTKLTPEMYQSKECPDSLDEIIWPLVRTLNLNGFTTHFSCEGEYLLLNESYIFPWVTVYSEIDTKKVLRLQQVLDDYNSKNEINWSFSFMKIGFPELYTLRPITKAPIEQLQATIPELAKYLDDNF